MSLASQYTPNVYSYFLPMLLAQLTPDHVGQTTTLQGWVIHNRSSGKIAFLEIRDGSGFIQAVIEQKNVGDELFESLTGLGIESAVSLTGTISKHPKKDEYELQVASGHVISATQDYPLGQKEHGIEFLFDNRHLHLRAKSQRAIQRVRDTIIQSTYTFMKDNYFTKFDSPIFTPTACEGTTELYSVEHVNGETMYLSQSGQLYLEAGIMAHGRVFDFGPVFRAEKSKTRRHLNEFWMMDAEMAFMGQEENMQMQENLIYAQIQAVLAKNKPELAILERDLTKLEQITVPFPRIKYVDIVAELQTMGSDIKLGDDLGGDDEEILMNKYQQPVFVTHYPKEVKSFYMKEDPANPGYVLNADLLAPEGYGEVIGGSQRDDDYEVLLQKIKDHKLPVEYFERYLDSRKYGSVPHSGFGFGLERLVRWYTGIHHVRETIPFPRYANRITP